jgi:hypothetical protein
MQYDTPALTTVLLEPVDGEDGTPTTPPTYVYRVKDIKGQVIAERMQAQVKRANGSYHPADRGIGYFKGPFDRREFVLVNSFEVERSATV